MTRDFSRINAAALKHLPKKRNKYGAESTTYDGNRYDSRKEAAYAATLDMLRKAKIPSERVKSYERQVRIPLEVNGVTVAHWRIDFVVTYADGSVRYEEVKGYETPEYRIKRRLFEAIYPERELKVIK